VIEQRIQICSLGVAQALGGRSPRIGLGPGELLGKSVLLSLVSRAYALVHAK
jgi:hypothetical protein